YPDELPAVRQGTQHVPRNSNRNRNPRDRRTPRLPFATLTPDEQIRCKRERRQKQSDRAFRQNAETESGIETVKQESASLARFGLRDKKVPQRDRKRRGQQHVRGRCASECEPTDRRGKYQRGNETCSAIPQPAATPINKKHGYGRSEGRRESRAGFID